MAIIHLFCTIYYSRAPMATFHEAKHAVIFMNIDDVKGQMVTSGVDRVIKVSLYEY